MRKPNASGPCKTSPSWGHFTKIPKFESQKPTVICNYCGKSYLFDIKTHGTTNMPSHSKVYYKNTNNLINDQNQIVLTFSPNIVGGVDLVKINHKFNFKSCRKPLAKNIILDE